MNAIQMLNKVAQTKVEIKSIFDEYGYNYHFFGIHCYVVNKIDDEDFDIIHDESDLVEDGDYYFQFDIESNDETILREHEEVTSKDEVILEDLKDYIKTWLCEAQYNESEYDEEEYDEEEYDEEEYDEEE